jgi:hypothetical protein
MKRTRGERDGRCSPEYLEQGETPCSLTSMIWPPRREPLSMSTVKVCRINDIRFEGCEGRKKEKKDELYSQRDQNGDENQSPGPSAIRTNSSTGGIVHSNQHATSPIGLLEALRKWDTLWRHSHLIGVIYATYVNRQKSKCDGCDCVGGIAKPSQLSKDKSDPPTILL